MGILNTVNGQEAALRDLSLTEQNAWLDGQLCVTVHKIVNLAKRSMLLRKNLWTSMMNRGIRSFEIIQLAININSEHEQVNPEVFRIL
jgi:hypothetical protein